MRSVFFYNRFKAYYELFHNNTDVEHYINKVKDCKQFIIDDPLLLHTMKFVLFIYYLLKHEYYQALVALEEIYAISSNNNMHSFEVVYLFQKASIIGEHLGSPSKGIEPLKKAVNLAKKENRMPYIGRSLHNLGILYSKLDMKEKAINSWKEALYYKRKSKEQHIILTTLSELANHYLQKEDLRDIIQSLPYIEEGLEVADRIQHVKGYYEFKLLQSEYYLKVNEQQAFLSAIKECEEHYRQAEDNKKLQQVYDLYSRYYASIHKYKKAMEYSIKTDIRKELIWRQ